jgi:exonuclease VII large subunit
MRKIRGSINDGLKILSGMIDTFATAKNNLSKQHQSVSRELDNLEDSVARRIKSRCRDKLSQAKTNKRQLIYADIDSNISNDEFKQLMKQRVDELKDELVTTIQESFHHEVNSFETEVKEIAARFMKNVDEILDFNINCYFGDGKNGFTPDFKIDNGINKVGLLSSLGNAATLIWAAFQSTNPIGLTIIAATLLFRFAKAVLGYFSTSYKMEQQRKSANENLEKVFENIEKTFDKRLSEVGGEVSKMMKQLKEQLSGPLHSVQEILQAMQLASRDISHIATKIA